MTGLMMQAEYAAHRGVGKSAVSNWKRDGLLVFAKHPTTGREMVDVAQTDALIASRRDPMRGRPTSGTAAPAAIVAADAALPIEPAVSAAPSLADARFELIAEQRIGAALKNERDAGNLVPLIECERRLAETGRLVRERVQSAFRGMAERLAVERDPRVIMSIGEEELDRVFGDLASEIASGALDDEDDQADDQADQQDAA